MFTVYRHYKCNLWILTSTAVSGSALSCFFLPLHGWNICLYSIKTKTINQSFVFPQTPRIAEATERRQDPASPLQEVTKKGPLLCKTDVTDGKVMNKAHCGLRFVFLPPPSHSTPQKMQVEQRDEAIWQWIFSYLSSISWVSRHPHHPNPLKVSMIFSGFIKTAFIIC